MIVREKVAGLAKAVKRRRATGAQAAGLASRIQRGAIGGAVVGFIEKQFGDQIPTLPLIGRKGAIALAVYMFKPKNAILQDAGIAAATLSGYQFAKENKIDGPDDDDDEFDD